MDPAQKRGYRTAQRAGGIGTEGAPLWVRRGPTGQGQTYRKPPQKVPYVPKAVEVLSRGRTDPNPPKGYSNGNVDLSGIIRCGWPTTRDFQMGGLYPPPNPPHPPPDYTVRVVWDPRPARFPTGTTLLDRRSQTRVGEVSAGAGWGTRQRKHEMELVSGSVVGAAVG